MEKNILLDNIKNGGYTISAEQNIMVNEILRDAIVSRNYTLIAQVISSKAKVEVKTLQYALKEKVTNEVFGLLLNNT